MTADEALRPGLKGEALPSGEIVLRLAHAPKNFAQTGKASAVSFDLSSKDKEAALPSLSVFAERLTTPEQAMTLFDQPEATTLSYVSTWTPSVRCVPYRIRRRCRRWTCGGTP